MNISSRLSGLTGILKTETSIESARKALTNIYGKKKILKVLKGYWRNKN